MTSKIIVTDFLPGKEKKNKDQWKKAYDDLPKLIAKEEVKLVYDELDRYEELLLKREKGYEKERRDSQRAISRLLEDVRQVMALLPKQSPKERLRLAIERYTNSIKPGRNIK